MELSRAMVWFDSSDVYGHGAATRHPRAGSGTAQAKTARNRAPSCCATPAIPQLAWTLPPAVPSAVHHLHPLSRGRDKSNADSPALHPIPTGKSGSWHIFTLVSAAEGMAGAGDGPCSHLYLDSSRARAKFSLICSPVHAIPQETFN